jgi:hypothetical protein
MRDLMRECVEALPLLEGVGWAILGSFIAFGTVRVVPWALRAAHAPRAAFSPHKADRRLDVLASSVLVAWLAAVGFVAALVGEPNSIKDGVMWGLGGQALLAGMVPGAPQTDHS